MLAHGNLVIITYFSKDISMTVKEIIVRDQLFAMAQAFDTENFMLLEILGDVQLPGMFIVTNDCETEIENAID